MENLLTGLENVFTLNNMLAIWLGTLAGTIGGAIPGINASMTMALLLPFTWGMNPITALLMFVGVYCGGQYGGSIPAILIGTPGTTSSAATVVDGFLMHQKGQTGKAVGISLLSGGVGGFISTILLIFIAVPLASIALAFGPPEYFGLAIMGLTMIASLSGKNIVKGLIAGAFGLLLSTVGLDPFSPAIRFSFGSLNLVNGLEVIPVMMGMFAVGQVLYQIRSHEDLPGLDEKAMTQFPTWQEFWRCGPAMVIASVVGMIVGIMPGSGASIGCWIGYNEARRWSKQPELYGTGIMEGVAAPEAANNAVTGGALVPLLALGIPGSNSTAIMLAALMIHGLVPGPLLFLEHPDIPYSIFVGLFVANIAMLVVGYVFLKAAIKIVNIPEPILNAGIIALVFVGAFTINNNLFDVAVVFAFGILGYVMKVYGFPVTATVLGFVLGFLVETSLRRSLTLSDGSWMIFLERPIAAVLLAVAIITIVFSLYREFRPKSKDASSAA
mgnify:CR=1 FL=1